MYLTISCADKKDFDLCCFSQLSNKVLQQDLTHCKKNNVFTVSIIPDSNAEPAEEIIITLHKVVLKYAANKSKHRECTKQNTASSFVLDLMAKITIIDDDRK